MGPSCGLECEIFRNKKLANASHAFLGTCTRSTTCTVARDSYSYLNEKEVYLK